MPDRLRAISQPSACPSLLEVDRMGHDVLPVLLGREDVVFRLALFKSRRPRFQRFKRAAIQGIGSPSAGCRPASTDTDRTGSQIDLLPLQQTQFSRTHAGVQRKNPRRIQTAGAAFETRRE